ncbi:MAG: glutathione peroxidase, partial [Pseudomonadota bacterium]|nr:glutathione peroxidase [Pseudomonadota bacterium]
MSVLDYTMPLLNGKDQDLSEYEGKVVLIVNTASKCGFTPQYDGLETLYQDLKDKGLVILGFPCNQFGKQEPGSADDIGAFCQKNYGVSFPMFSKIDVNGSDAA